MILGDHSETKVRDARTTGIVHEDICLDLCQSCGETKFTITAHSFKIPVYHVARMEVVEAIGNVEQLAFEVSVG